MNLCLSTLLNNKVWSELPAFQPLIAYGFGPGLSKSRKDKPNYRPTPVIIVCLSNNIHGLMGCSSKPVRKREIKQRSSSWLYLLYVDKWMYDALSLYSGMTQKKVGKEKWYRWAEFLLWTYHGSEYGSTLAHVQSLKYWSGTCRELNWKINDEEVWGTGLYMATHKGHRWYKYLCLKI